MEVTMLDVWSFLLQTLSAAGCAVLLLIIKNLFKDKLTPEWQFAVWGTLAVILVIPTGCFGSYTVLNWNVPLDMVKTWTGDYSVTRVLFPIPWLTDKPENAADWVFAAYVLGVVLHVISYVISYLRLRLSLMGCNAPTEEVRCRAEWLAAEHKLKVPRMITVKGLPSPFVYGIISPTLVLPEGEEIDQSVILHELFHIKYKDTLWSSVICLFRSIHWCNPIIIYCAKYALNDLESRCDSKVLETLSGEMRRHYGIRLLEMANDRFTSTPAATRINNGGKAIRRRIEAITRFKKYPVGMGLVSACVIFILTLSLATGVIADVPKFDGAPTHSVALARTTPCTTPEGAFDTYAKAVLTKNGYYRLMCAPIEDHKELSSELIKKGSRGGTYSWEAGYDSLADSNKGYYIYNIIKNGDNYEGLLAFYLVYAPEGAYEKDGLKHIAYQTVKVTKEDGRWVAVPVGDFEYTTTYNSLLGYGCKEMPYLEYTGVMGDLQVFIGEQHVYTKDSYVRINGIFDTSSQYNTVPFPNARFSKVSVDQQISILLAPGVENPTHIGISAAPVYGDDYPDEEFFIPTGTNGGGTNPNGGVYWGREISKSTDLTEKFNLGGCGSTYQPASIRDFPTSYVADVYINEGLTGRVDLKFSEVTSNVR